MAEGDNGRRRGDDAFDVDDILPELSEFDPDLDDLLDLSEAPEPLPAPPDPPTRPRSQPWRPTPPPNRPEPPSERTERDAPPPRRSEPPDHRLSERPSPPEQRRSSPPPAEPKRPRASSRDDDLEIPDFVRSEPEPTPEPTPEPEAPVEEHEPVREEWGGRAARREPDWPAAPSPEPPDTRSPGAAADVDDLMPPEPEGPAFIDRVVDRRHEVEGLSWESARLEPEPEPFEPEPFEPEPIEPEPFEPEPIEPEPIEHEPHDDIWITDAPDADAEVYEEMLDEAEDGAESEAAPVDPLAPDHEPAAVPLPDEAPPRLPGTPVSEIDSFAAQLGDLLSTDEPEPGPVDTDPRDTGEVVPDHATGTHEPRATSDVASAPRAPGTRPTPPSVATALATRAPTPAEFAPVLPPLPTVALRRAPCAEDGQRVEAHTETDSPSSSYPWAIRAAVVVLALAAAAAVVLTNPRSGDDDPGNEAAPAAADVEEVAGDDPDAAAPADVQEPATPVDGGVNLVAEADVPLVDVYPEPDAAQADTSLEHPTEVGGPLVFLVEEQRGEWLRVQLPVRDDGETGWVQAEQVTLSRHEYRIEVRLSEHRLEMFRGDESVFETQIAVGEDAPEPGSDFYIKELLKPPNPDSTYGEYAFGFSGFSNTLDKFTSGKDVVAIHGVDDPSVIGTDVAAGCIGMTNEDLGDLVGELPLGTPVELLA